jgi:RNA recognition motif-containing protein
MEKCVCATLCDNYALHAKQFCWSLGMAHYLYLFYGSRDARVMWDQKTGRSRGFGFVSFRSQQVYFCIKILILFLEQENIMVFLTCIFVIL